MEESIVLQVFWNAEGIGHCFGADARFKQH
jgi:hypothetical protein